jgi:enoyl-CoA hydratase/carnithine racemase
MKYQYLIYKKKDKVVWITFNRPEVLNAINLGLHNELVEALNEANRDASISVVVLCGSGRAWSVGHDLKEDVHHPLQGVEEWRSAFKRTMDLCFQIWDLDKPVIASINGYCLGKAHQIMQACDLKIAAEEAMLGEPEVKFVAASTFPLITWLVGLNKAKELMLTGDKITGKEAERIGLVNKAVPGDQLASETEQLAEKLACIPLAALQLNKRSINRTFEAAGMRTAFLANIEYISAVECLAAQEGERAEFTNQLRDHGMKEALAYRDRQS